MDRADAIYSTSGALNFSLHWVHLNKIFPLSIVSTPYYREATMPAHAFPYSFRSDGSRTVLLPSPECWETVCRNTCKCIWTFRCLHTTCGDLCCCRLDDMCRCRRSMNVHRGTSSRNTHSNNSFFPWLLNLVRILQLWRRARTGRYDACFHCF